MTKRKPSPPPAPKTDGLEPPPGPSPVLRAAKPIRLLLVDDHPVVREGLRSCLRHPRLHIVGEAASGEEALRQTVRLKPDLVLMDINLPDITGLEATVRLRKLLPATRVLFLSMHDGREYLAQVAHSGASGYVLKEAAPEELVQAIETVHRGEAYFSPSVAAAMLEALTPASTAELSKRERDVMAAIAMGESSKEIGRRLRLSPNTVRTYRARLRRKLDLHTVAAFTEYAVRNGLIRRPATKKPGH